MNEGKVMSKEIKKGFVRHLDGTIQELPASKGLSRAKRVARRVWYKNAKIARSNGSFNLSAFCIRRAYANK